MEFIEKGVYMEEINQIRKRIAENRLTHVWMIYHLHLHGIETDKTEFSSVLAGTRKGAKAESIIRCCKEILDRYDLCWTNY